ncbi:uncharacterized protein TNCV_3036851 [Trichonephila clavipes]|nr:uncharacterized protein TNCV_3036851 [Trichonephila clavipes]
MELGNVEGHLSLNGCVSAISIDTGKVLDMEVMSKMCRLCLKKHENKLPSVEKHVGSSGAMEPVVVCTEYSKDLLRRENCNMYIFMEMGIREQFDAVKNIYGENSVKRFECIGPHSKACWLKASKRIEAEAKRSGRLWEISLMVSSDKLQNYYGIAIGSNVNNIEKMQSAVIAAFFIAVNKNQPMHGQCPVGPDTWCKFQRATFEGKMHIDTGKGLPQKLIKIIKPHYMKLCDKDLLNKCLHGKTQNANESFNGILWKFIPKDILSSYKL